MKQFEKAIYSMAALAAFAWSSTANSQLSQKLKQACEPAFRSAQEKAIPQGLMCDIWTDPDCRAMAIQKGLLRPDCAFPKVMSPIPKKE